MTVRLGSHWTEVSGVRVFARVSSGLGSGRSDPIVLVHGQVISSRYMVPTAELLAPEFRVFAPDLPGFGLSGKPKRVLSVPELADALAGWMEANAFERASLVANSLGCQIVVDLAVRHPELAGALVLAGPTIDPRGRSAPVQIARWFMDWPGERPSLALAHLQDYARAGLRRTLHTFRHALADRIEDKLPLVQCPTLVVRGERDPIVPQRWAEEAARLLPRGRLLVIPGGPHCVNYSTPRAFARVVRTFLRGCGPGSAHYPQSGRESPIRRLPSTR
jgi:2-hydroxy-6-oxonona-2,4-dienedioate hydrolase